MFNRQLATAASQVGTLSLTCVDLFLMLRRRAECLRHLLRVCWLEFVLVCLVPSLNSEYLGLHDKQTLDYLRWPQPFRFSPGSCPPPPPRSSLQLMSRFPCFSGWFTAVSPAARRRRKTIKGQRETERSRYSTKTVGGLGRSGGFNLKSTTVGPNNSDGWIRVRDPEHPVSSLHPRLTCPNGTLGRKRLHPPGDNNVPSGATSGKSHLFLFYQLFTWL